MSSEPITRASVGLRSERGPILLSVMLSVGLVAIDSTILATAVTAIVRDLGGFAQFPWLFSVYLLGQAVAVPIYGKISDLVGRKAVMIFGIAMFVIGSILCGLAWNMTALIVFRAVQGLGAGAVQPMGMTIVGDIYSVAERAKVQGYLASVWAIAAVTGPTLGGIFADTIGWRWVFWINVPLGLAAGWVLIRRFHENVKRARHRIDYAGAALIALGSALLVLGLLEGGVRWEWGSWQSLSVLGGGVLALVAAALVERRAAEPILPSWIFKDRMQMGADTVGLMAGAVLIGLTSFVPLYGQGALHTSALVAGLALAALSLGWPLAAANSGRLYLRIGFRDTSTIGAFLTILGAVTLLPLGPTSSIWHVAASCFLIGMGMGLMVSPTMVALQASVPWHQRGVATSANAFSRSIGSALGAAVFGALANASLGIQVGGAKLDPSDFTPAQMSDAVHLVFVGTLVAAVLALFAVLLMPRRPAPQGDEISSARDESPAPAEQAAGES